jgi:membrane protease YdiL (CAAX protease family)
MSIVTISLRPARKAAPPQSEDGKRRPGFTTRSLWVFFLATFGLSWGAGVTYVVFSDQIESVLGPMGYTNPLFILMVHTPGLVGVAMVWRCYGPQGLRRFFRRFTLWRMSAGWWALLLLAVPATYFAGAALVGGDLNPFHATTVGAVVTGALAMVLIGPIEELGWRGVALPLLQRRFTPLAAGLLLGLVVALWHTPAFLMSGTKQSVWAFWPFFFGVIAVGVILTAMFNAARGSLLVAFMFHAQLNNPAWPDGQPWDMWLFVALAVVVVLVNHKAMLDRSGGITAVVGAPEADTTGSFDQHVAHGTPPFGPHTHGRTANQRGASGSGHRVALALVAGFLAANAWYGAFGLATGWLTIGEKLTARLPFGSAVLGGVALAVVVAAPATTLAVMALHRSSRRLDAATFMLGAVVVAWILIELAFVREVSFLHPAILLYGTALMAWGRHGAPRVGRALLHPSQLRPGQ